MAVNEHVVEDDAENINENKKIRSTVLDNFRKLTHNKKKIRLKSSAALLKHIFDNKDTENGKTELKYALGRLIRGLGASKNTSKIGFYTVLVALLNFIEEISVSDIFECVKRELHSSASNSKSENADVSAGQILLYGALIRTGFYEKATIDEKKQIVEQLLVAGKKRDYLYLSCITFVIELCNKTNENDFQSIVWPLLKSEVEKPWQEQNMDSVYLFYVLRNKYPNVVNKKYVKRYLGSNEIYSKDVFNELTNILLNVPRITVSSHPFYEIISRRITSENLTVNFIKAIDDNLLKYNYNRHYIATNIITNCLQNSEKVEIIPDLLNKNYIQHTLQYFKSVKSSKNPEALQETVYKMFNVMIERLKSENVGSDTKIEAIRKLLFYPGIFIFEKITRCKIVQNIIATLDFEGIEKLADLYRSLIEGKNDMFVTSDEKQACLNNDKVYASQLLVKLLSHPNANDKVSWKMEQLKFLMCLSLYRNENGKNISVELAASIKATFYNALSLKLSKLKDLRDVLSILVSDVNNRLNERHLLRNPLTEEAKEMWNKSLQYVQKLESKHKKIHTVFHTLFLHMSLQLFNEAKLATDSLKELFSCYERIRSEKKQGQESNAEDPLWIEVVVDLFLNLLSHKSSLLRNLINCVFPHLCKYLNITAMHQILDVLDPKNEGNPLIPEDEDDESISEDEKSGDDEDVEESDDEDSDGDENMDTNVNDKLKMAVQMALGGYKSDEESVDLDQMSESEGKKIDEALATAFKQFKPHIGKKSNKQKKEDEALTHFRVRVLDLIDLYLDSDPSMYLCLEIMLVLLRCLEFTIKDEHQKPLLNRIRASLKKLCNVRKFNSIEDIEDTTLPDLLNSLLEKGTKNYFVMQEMNDKISECCLFIVKCTEYLNSLEEVPKKLKKHPKKAIASTILECLDMYFAKRESYIPYGLFKNIFQSNWSGCYKLIIPVLRYIFNDNIRAFKRCQALELAKLFFGNHRLLTTYSATESFDESLEIFGTNVVELLNTTQNISVKEKFIRDIMIVLTAVKKSPINHEKIDWDQIGKSLREFRSNVAFTKHTKIAYNKVCRVLDIDGAVTLKSNLIKLGNAHANDRSDDENETVEDDAKVNKKGKKLNNTKLKKETQILRMQSLSEGLMVDFTESDIKEEKLDDDRINGKRSVSDDEDSDVSDESPKKKLKIRNVSQNKRKAKRKSLKK